MGEAIKHFGSAIGVLIIFAVVVLIGFIITGLIIHGIAWLSDSILPILLDVNKIVFLVCLGILSPLAFFEKLRDFIGGCFKLSAFIFGFTLWLWSFLLTYELWGVTAVYIGISAVGVGVIPIAMLATMFNGMWSIFGQLIILTVLAIITGSVGSALTEDI